MVQRTLQAVCVREARSRDTRLEYKDVAKRCSQSLFEEYLKYVKRMREKLKKLSKGSKQWWRVAKQLMDRSAMSSGIPALKAGDERVFLGENVCC